MSGAETGKEAGSTEVGRRFSADSLRAFATRVYTALGLPAIDAARVADTLVQADLWGHQSHGVMRTFWYASRLKSGATQARPTLERVVDAGAVTVLDAGDAMGQVATQAAVDIAAEAAPAHGIAAVAVRHSGHFGTAMYFTRQLARAGCIGVLTTNASPAMAPFGGREKRVGTNPWSIAAPAGRHAPMMLDIANTAVARGKLYLARQRNETIPDGWAADAEGVPTNDPVAGIAGNILPMAGHKGYAIATMMDVLSGVLSGSAFGDAVVGPYEPEGRSGVGHLLVALHVPSFRPMADFEADMEALVARLRSTPLAPGVEAIRYPGELEAVAEARHLAEGIEIPADTVADLVAGAGELGVSPPEADA